MKSCFASTETAFFVFVVSFKEWGSSMSPRFYLFVSDVNQGNVQAGWVQDFLG